LIGKGMNIFRIQFLMERLVPSSMTGSYNEEYLANLTTVGLSSSKIGLDKADSTRLWTPSQRPDLMPFWTPTTMADSE
jgi:hypothetical protein